MLNIYYIVYVNVLVTIIKNSLSLSLYAESNNIDGILMLIIDFEKAFDSISWKFMYHALYQFENIRVDYRVLSNQDHS